jgi:hypothetical protein
MTFLGDTVTMTDDQFCDYVIYQNNALNLSVDDIPTFISKEESPHIKDVMKSALSDFFQKHQTLPRMKCREIAQDIAVVFSIQMQGDCLTMCYLTCLNEEQIVGKM